MFMNLEDAVSEAKELEDIDEILSSGGFLCSAYLMIEKGKDPESWNLAFYSENENEITAVEVTESGPTIGVTDAPLREDTGEIKLEKVNTGADEALEKIKEVLEEEFSISYEKTLLTLKSGEDKQEWRAVFVGKSLSIVSIAIDADTGEVTEKERRSMSAGKSFGG